MPLIINGRKKRTDCDSDDDPEPPQIPTRRTTGRNQPSRRLAKESAMDRTRKHHSPSTATPATIDLFILDCCLYQPNRDVEIYLKGGKFLRLKPTFHSLYALGQFLLNELFTNLAKARFPEHSKPSQEELEETILKVLRLDTAQFRVQFHGAEDCNHLLDNRLPVAYHDGQKPIHVHIIPKHSQKAQLAHPYDPVIQPQELDDDVALPDPELRVRICPAHEPNSITVQGRHVVKWINVSKFDHNFHSLNDLRLHLLGALELDASHYSVDLFPSCSCGDPMLGNTLPSDFHDGFVPLEVHFSLYQPHEASLNAAEIAGDAKESGNTSEVDNQNGPGDTEEMGEAEQTEAIVEMESDETNQPKDDEFKYIRIGYERKRCNGSDIPRMVVALAAINLRTRGIQFILVDSWNINNMRLANFKQGLVVDFAEGVFDMDPAFQGYEEDDDIVSRLHEIVDGKLETRSNSEKKTTKATGNKVVTLRDPPIEPEYVVDDAPPALTRPAGKGVVNIVIFFKNNTSIDIDMIPLVNVKCIEDDDQTYDGFLPYIREGNNNDDSNEDEEDDRENEEGRKRFPGLNTYLSDWLNDHWDFTIWVLPQIPNTSSLYCWSNLTKCTMAGRLTNASKGDADRDSTLKDWLSHSHVDKFGQRLYMEVHISAKTGEEDMLKGIGKAKKGTRSTKPQKGAKKS